MSRAAGGVEPHKLPPPPQPLPQPTPDEIRLLDTSTQIVRIYFRGGDHPTAWDQFRQFGPTTSRFDHHLVDESGKPQVADRGIIYGAEALTTCCAEVFQLPRLIDRAGRSPWLVMFSPVRPLRLLAVAGYWATRAKASTLLNNGPKSLCREWAREIYRTFTDIDGIAYASSMAGHAPAFALFERARDALPARPVYHHALDHPALETALYNAAHQLGYDVS